VISLEGLSQTLSQEVGPLGIKVTAVAPGACRTDFASGQNLFFSAVDSSAGVELFALTNDVPVPAADSATSDAGGVRIVPGSWTTVVAKWHRNCHYATQNGITVAILR
jgi:NAD(P)-dependent dehydrogenase (short-subunit alcohol dehydrogenase family)